MTTASTTKAASHCLSYMSVTGLCGICESSPAVERCRSCGTLVCHNHYRETKELCTQCAASADPSSDEPTRRL